MSVPRRPSELAPQAQVLAEEDIFIVSTNLSGTTPNSRRASLALVRESVLKGIVSTSTNRPMSPYRGQLLFETDTNKLNVYTSAGWEQLGGALPIGAITMWGTPVPPAGWLLLDGSAYSRVDFEDLFNLWGTRFGAGDGVNTFNVPNMRGRVPVGLNVTDGDFNLLGRAGGSKTQSLTTTHLPNHSHGAGSLGTAGAGAHKHTMDGDPGLRYVVTQPPGQQNTLVFPGTTGTNQQVSFSDIDPVGDHTHAVTGRTTAEGGGGGFSVLSPFMVLNFIVKAR